MPKIRELDKDDFLKLLDIYLSETGDVKRKTHTDMKIFRKAIAGEEFETYPAWKPFSNKGYEDLFKESIFLMRLHQEAMWRFLQIWPEYTPKDD